MGQCVRLGRVRSRPQQAYAPHHQRFDRAHAPPPPQKRLNAYVSDAYAQAQAYAPTDDDDERRRPRPPPRDDDDDDRPPPPPGARPPKGCASTFKKETTRCDYNCPHDVAQRRYVATYTSVELAKALECGYTVDRFYRAWHYEEEADDLFKGYVRLFLKLKEEASGFPKGVETEEQKDMWREEYKEKYGIDIELAKVKKNPGLRTTSMARLKLLEFMREAESHGGEILYTDTDSIFVRHDRDVEPITTGKYLGEMSEEYGCYRGEAVRTEDEEQTDGGDRIRYED
ncbi:hypothetical protein niasHT_022812 [Heterodera trifolii]|uniref:DNA-directed DNA polymerase n=1 Tax=Heterodera trifolii TaxID=157864 RepID=A0ABD2JWY3_9BILA